MAPGWASLIGVTMMMGGAQLIFIGLIGQYLARVFEELKGRPMYIFKQEPVLPEPRGASAEPAPLGGAQLTAAPPAPYPIRHA